jgi:hypothetical protein
MKVNRQEVFSDNEKETVRKGQRLDDEKDQLWIRGKTKKQY